MSIVNDPAILMKSQIDVNMKYCICINYTYKECILNNHNRNKNVSKNGFPFFSVSSIFRLILIRFVFLSVFYYTNHLIMSIPDYNPRPTVPQVIS